MRVAIVSESWKKLVEEANDSYGRGKVPEAEVKLLAALEEAENFGEDDARLALTLNNLAAIYHEQGKYTMAEPHYKRALDIRIRLHGETHPDIAVNHHNLAVLYSARRMYPMAENHYKLALQMKEELHGKDSAELLNTLQYYAQLMKVQNRLVERQMIESRAKTIAAKLGMDQEATPVSLKRGNAAAAKGIKVTAISEEASSKSHEEHGHGGSGCCGSQETKEENSSKATVG